MMAGTPSPELRILAIPFLVAASFAAQTAGDYLLVTLILGWIAVRTGSGWRELLYPVVRLKYLLAVTLLLHLLMTPGRTLWGLSWLSLDGLLRGGRLSMSLALAVIASGLLTRGLAGGDLVRLLKGVSRPFECSGFRLEPLMLAVAGVFHFLPQVVTAGGVLRNGSRAERAGGVRLMLCQLFEEADRIAYEEASGEDPLHIRSMDGPLQLRGSITDLVLLCSLVVVICKVWLVR